MFRKPRTKAPGRTAGPGRQRRARASLRRERAGPTVASRTAPVRRGERIERPPRGAGPTRLRRTNPFPPCKHLFRRIESRRTARFSSLRPPPWMCGIVTSASSSEGDHEHARCHRRDGSSSAPPSRQPPRHSKSPRPRQASGPPGQGPDRTSRARRRRDRAPGSSRSGLVFGSRDLGPIHRRDLRRRRHPRLRLHPHLVDPPGCPRTPLRRHPGRDGRPVGRTCA